MYGGSPVVLVFARKTDDHLASLVKKLDELVKEKEEQKLKAFVCMIGGDNRDELEANAKKFVEDNEIENVPIVVPVEFENGPEDFGINPEVDATVMCYSGIKVRANHVVMLESLEEEEDREKIFETILDDTKKLLEKD